MLHDNVLTALKQVSDIPIHLGKAKTSYGNEFYWFTLKEQKHQRNSFWAVNGDQVPSYDELSISASSLVDPIWSEGAKVPFWDKTLRKLAWNTRPQPKRDTLQLFNRRTTHNSREILQQMNEQEHHLSFSRTVNYS
jgi:hypothetical protein